MTANQSRNLRSSQRSNDDEKIVPDVSIPGVDKLLDPQYTLLGKCIWGIAVVTCLSVCLAQIHNRVLLYLSKPVSISVNVSRVDVIPFPSLTVCPFYPFLYQQEIIDLKKRYAKIHNITVSENVSEIGKDVPYLKLLDLPDMNASKLWELTSIDRNISELQILCDYHNRRNCNKKIQKLELITFLGICFTIAIDSELEYDGAYNGIKLIIQTPENLNVMYWKHSVTKILLHERKFQPQHTLSDELGQMIHPFYETHSKAYVKQFRYYNSSVNPCDSRVTVETCRVECIESRLVQNMSCRLPYVTRSSLPLCDDFASAETFRRQTDYVYKNHRNLCNHCRRKCKENIYGMLQNVVKPAKETWIEIMIMDNVIEMVEEHSSYPIQALLSDIGGNLGLFLGFCLLTALQILEALIIKIKSALLRKIHSSKKFCQKQKIHNENENSDKNLDISIYSEKKMNKAWN